MTKEEEILDPLSLNHSQNFPKCKSMGSFSQSSFFGTNFSILHSNGPANNELIGLDWPHWTSFVRNTKVVLKRVVGKCSQTGYILYRKIFNMADFLNRLLVWRTGRLWLTTTLGTTATSPSSGRPWAATRAQRTGGSGYCASFKKKVQIDMIHPLFKRDSM